MSDTARLKLPLLQPSQAQKHVTVNEALTRLDGVVQLVLESRSVTTPPSVVVDGVCYGIPAGAVNAWAGQDGRIAIGANGGWEFVTPGRGWRAMIVDEGVQAIHDGTGWRAGQLSLSPANAGLVVRVVEFDHVIQPGPLSVTSPVIPAGAVVIGVTGRVIQDITGTAGSWALGNPGASGRYGSGLGMGVGSWVRGVLGQPMAFYAPEALQIEAEGGDLTGGVVRLAVHFMELALPDL